ncbi:MAG: proline racemase family protein [Verrucomicrobiae bacterium]|nr:proline racemase family protein [Verrucomicrobiae bacterium]
METFPESGTRSLRRAPRVSHDAEATAASGSGSEASRLRVSVVDSHTGGEPTRVVIAGAPDLGGGPVAAQAEVFRRDHDRFRSAVVHEPRGSDVLVGALLVPPSDASCAAGVLFFNNVGLLGMCGHGTIGLVATLAHLGTLSPGEHRVETPVGVVTATLHADGSVSVANVPSHRQARGVAMSVPGIGTVTGDVAWGGNWFFLVREPVWPLELRDVESLTEQSWRIRQAVNAQGFPEVDHVELFGPPRTPGGSSRNFVLCPGKAYDRSPCGTGTSAKLACLAADGRLAEGEAWIQESILGSTFTGRYRWLDRAAGRILPTITGTAHVTSEATLLLDASDPFRWGIR